MSYMCNELLFFLHIIAAVFFLIIATMMGKSTLSSCIASLWLFANFFVTKQIELFSYTVTASDVYTVAAMYGMSIFQERYGKKEAIYTIYISFFLLILGACFSFFHLSYVPSPVDKTQFAFMTLLSSTPRLALASIATFFITSRIEIYLFQLLRITPLSFSLRSGISVFLSSGIDTALFTYIGLYGLIENPYAVCILSYAIKIGTIICTGPFLYFARRFIPYTAG